MQSTHSCVLRGKRQSIRSFLWLVLQGKRFGTKRPAVQIRPARLMLAILRAKSARRGFVPHLRPARQLSIRIDHVCFAGALRFLRPARYMLATLRARSARRGLVPRLRPARYMLTISTHFYIFPPESASSVSTLIGLKEFHLRSCGRRECCGKRHRNAYLHL